MARKAKAKKKAARTPARKTHPSARRRSGPPRAAAKSPRAAGKLKLSMLTGSYEIVRALQEGRVQPKGIELSVARFPGTGAIHDHVAQGRAADINEFNGGHYVVQKANGRDDITAIPVFLHRRFRHGFIYVNRAKVKEPKDLIGKTIGSVSIGPAANYWMRGYLEDFGVPHRSVTWMIDHADDQSAQAPKEMKIQMTPKGRRSAEMLLSGEIEGYISPSITRMIGEEDPRVGRLWPDYEKVEGEYYKRTGFFPIMHVTTVPTKIYRKHPWIVESLVNAFEEAKQIAYQRLLNPRVVPFAWYRTYWEQEHRFFGGKDPWEYGFSDLNRRNYDTLIGYVHDQILSGPRPRIEDLFARESFDIPTPLPTYHRINYEEEGGRGNAA